MTKELNDELIILLTYILDGAADVNDDNLEETMVKFQIALYPYKDEIDLLGSRLSEDDYYEARDRFVHKMIEKNEVRELFKAQGLDFRFELDKGERS